MWPAHQRLASRTGVWRPCRASVALSFFFEWTCVVSGTGERARGTCVPAVNNRAGSESVAAPSKQTSIYSKHGHDQRTKFVERCVLSHNNLFRTKLTIIIMSACDVVQASSHSTFLPSTRDFAFARRHWDRMIVGGRTLSQPHFRNQYA